MKGMCSAERGQLASQQIWADLIWAPSQRMIFLKERVHPAPKCMVGPSSLVCMVVAPLPCLLLPPWHLLLALQGARLTSLGSSTEMDGTVSWLRLSSNVITSAWDCPCPALHQPLSSTAHLLLDLLLISGYTYTSKLERDRTWAFTAGLQLSWWHT